MFRGMHGGYGRDRGCGPRGGSRHDRWGQFAAEFAARWEEAQHRGGRSRRMFDSGELRLVLLKLIADEPRHGYDLIRAIEELTGGGYAPSPGIVYPTLTLLDEMGQIEEQASAGVKKRFAATDAGHAFLAENAEQVAALIARLSALGEHRERSDRAPIRRAMGNLREVLKHRLFHAELSDEAALQVAALIDEVAQKIERLR